MEEKTESEVPLSSVAQHDGRRKPGPKPKHFEPMEQQIGNDAVMAFDDSDEPQLVEISSNSADAYRMKQKQEELAFLEEFIDVMIHEDSNKFAEPIVQVSVNGRNQFFERGKVQSVRRKFVECLARAKPVAHDNIEFTKQNGERDYMYPSRASLKYPFSVIHDPNPKGRDWLKGILSRA